MLKRDSYWLTRYITSSVFINDDESGLHHDFEVWLEKLAPEKPYSQYRHNGFEDNADAHLKRTVMDVKLYALLQTGNSILVRGNRFSMVNSTVKEENGYW